MELFPQKEDKTRMPGWDYIRKSDGLQIKILLFGLNTDFFTPIHIHSARYRQVMKNEILHFRSFPTGCIVKTGAVS